MKKSLLLILLCSLAIFSWSQGTLSGVISDGDIGETLIGANVVIENTTIGTSTDFDGKYQFQMEPGTYNVIISYLGFTDKKIQDVEIKENEVTYLDVTMSSAGVDLGIEVVVEARSVQRSENAVLQLQRKSDKILDGISSQEMSKYSLSNVASAMSRISGATVSGGKNIYIRGLGDRYSSTLLNGLPLPSTDPYKNTPQLDLIPTNLLDNIITSKSFTPDLPANFTGGNVNIKTKTFPEQYFITVSTKLGYNTQSNLIDDFLTYQGASSDYWGFSDKDAFPSFLRDPEFQDMYLYSNVNIDARRDDEIASTIDGAIKSVALDFVPENKSTPVNHQFGVSMGNQFSMRGSSALGTIFSLSFNKDYSHLPNYIRRNWQLQEGELDNRGDYVETRSSETAVINAMLGLTYKFNNLHSIGITSLYNHDGNKVSRYSFGERPEQITDDLRYEGRGLEFIERQLFNTQITGTHVLESLNHLSITWSGAYTNANQEEPLTRYFENAQNFERDPITTFFPENAVQDPSIYLRDLKDDQYTAKVDLELPIHNNKHKFKVGALYVTKDRDFEEELYNTVLGRDGTKFNGNFDEFYGDHNLGWLGKSEGNGRNLIANYLILASDDGNKYAGTEEITSVYAMFNINPLPKLKFVGGLRVEKTDIEVIGKDERKPIEERRGVIDETDLFPVSNLIYSLSDDMNIRAAYSKTIARPNMREISPFIIYDPLSATFINGNPNLERTLIDNYDIRWEYFLKAGEIISLSGYYKDFTDPIQQRFIPSANREIIFTNVPSAYVYGVEIEIRKSLGFITSAIENFKLNTNFSFIESESDVEQVSQFSQESRPFEGQANFIANVALLYQNKANDLNATLSLNHVGERLAYLGADGNPDVYQAPISQLNLNLQKRLGDLGLSFSVQNILDAESKFSSTFNGVEYIDNQFKRGVSFSFGIAYTIK